MEKNRITTIGIDPRLKAAQSAVADNLSNITIEAMAKKYFSEIIDKMHRFALLCTRWRITTTYKSTVTGNHDLAQTQ
ncbi:hypothetical protein [Solemya elarraichensis gill symbiont]|uniref:Uncharacterized protein n=1 Tax=Solemya elarraichensis gill symbiont TaxID=1918949 RepID=A0A1T2L1Z7_9GAMM|nr:hypothetical protein [Solemya elarraichensis gill symbiont]OOZ39125.1 hypothetical protein BOW52_07605 [Solemya elarraichensis gill symbiont]